MPGGTGRDDRVWPPARRRRHASAAGRGRRASVVTDGRAHPRPGVDDAERVLEAVDGRRLERGRCCSAPWWPRSPARPGPTAAATPPDIDRDGLSNTFEIGRSLTNPRLRGYRRRRHARRGRGSGQRRAHERRRAGRGLQPAPRRHGWRRARRRDGSRPDPCAGPRPAGSGGLHGLPRHERLEHPDRRPAGALGQRDAHHLDRHDAQVPHGLRVVRGLRDPVPGRRLVDAPARGHVRLRRRVRSRPVSDPGRPADRGRLGRPPAHGRRGRLPPVRAVRRAPVGGAWYAGSGAQWDLASNALRPAGWTSADAAGLPIVPGLVRYDEVAAGGSATRSGSPSRRPRRATSTRPATGPRRPRARPCRRWGSASGSRRPRT